MTEIALRAYNQEIKDLIDHGHFDEAIAHCQHVLETFPRHIETYRLLGKAFLEQGRHGDAADVFQRVLSAIPEDWLSHVAMAIVREDESNLDMAIWHMERAYEVNPSNPTVQQEVRRLRGRRDGVEPPKLRLTRSALARMYIKGGLYGQAIAEIRSALTEDPDRPDLQVLLASALFDSGAVQESADICTAILQKLPYCLEANRVMGMALLASNKHEDAEKLFQRIESLDPHIDLEVLKKEKRIAELPGQTVSLSRLEYEGQEKTVRTKQPSWASSLGLKIEEPQKGPAIPDWLSTASQPADAFPPAAQPAAPAAPTGDIPAWLNEAAAAVNQPSAGGSIFGTPAEPPPPSAAEPIPRTSTGELPDWIQAQAMPAEPPVAEKSSGSLPDWLSAAAAIPFQQPAAEMPGPSAPAASPTTGSALPDWIKTSSLPPDKPKEKISDIPDWLSAPPPPSVEALPSSSLPEWTRPETKTSPLGVEPNNIPDWLSSSQPTSADISPEPEWLKQSPAPAPGADAIPEWMKGAGPAESSPDAQPAESMPSWLQSSADPASKPVELVPEWMRTESPPSASAGSVQPSPPSAPIEDLPEWMKPDQNEAPISFPSSEPVLGGKKSTSPLAEESPAVPEGAVPDWMKPPETAPAAPLAAAAESVPESNKPDLRNPPTEAAAEVEARSVEAAPAVTLPDWLNPPAGLASPEAVEGAPSMAVPPPAGIASTPDVPFSREAEPAPVVELPDWLKAVPPPAAEPAQVAPPAIEAAAESPADSLPISELPDWLKGGPAQTPPMQERTASPAPPPERTEPAQPPIKASDLFTSEPGPTHVTPTASDGVDLPDWLVSQIQGKPADAAAAAPAPAQTAGPLPDWLKPATPGATPAPVVDWDKAASQPIPPAPVDATRPATGLSSSGSAGGASETPGALKPTGSDTVARWLDRRLKTSTLSSLDESALKAGVKPSTPPPTGKPGSSGTQLPTWLDSQKPGGSDTVVRWMDKRETGSLRKVTASFSSVSRSAVPAPEEQAASAPPAPAAAAPLAGIQAEENTTPSRIPVQAAPPVQPAAEAPAPVLPKRETPPASKPPEVVISNPPIAPVTQASAPVPAEDDEEGAFVPPPEWLQKALGSAVAEVPPIPKKQTGGLRPGTVTPVSSPAYAKPAPPVPAPQPAVPAVPAPVEPPAPVIRQRAIPVDEPPPSPSAEPGTWVPVAPVPASAPAAKPEKPAKKPSRKKARKLTDVETEVLIREARVYLETDLQKATEAYQQVIDDPSSAEVVAGDLTTYLEQDPASPQLWNLLGDACSRAGRLQDAYRAYAEALRRM
ncbi:MAG: tetratricopeptide repeat protein [Anaerolineales bacterium]|nr:tetratricopeptide repeat protein [Anaerolineales bacterium]